jgi:hypothetical protein
MMPEMDFPCLWPRGCEDRATERVKLVETGRDAEPAQVQLVFCRSHAQQLLERDEWFGPSLWREEGWFIGTESEAFDLGALLAADTPEARLLGRAVAYPGSSAESR